MRVQKTSWGVWKVARGGLYNGGRSICLVLDQIFLALLLVSLFNILKMILLLIFGLGTEILLLSLCDLVSRVGTIRVYQILCWFCGRIVINLNDSFCVFSIVFG